MAIHTWEPLKEDGALPLWDAGEYRAFGYAHVLRFKWELDVLVGDEADLIMRVPTDEIWIWDQLDWAASDASLPSNQVVWRGAPVTRAWSQGAQFTDPGGVYWRTCARHYHSAGIGVGRIYGSHSSGPPLSDVDNDRKQAVLLSSVWGPGEDMKIDLHGFKIIVTTTLAYHLFIERRKIPVDFSKKRYDADYWLALSVAGGR